MLLVATIWRFLPAGFEWLAFALTAFIIINIVINAGLGAVVVYIWGERRILGAYSEPHRSEPLGTFRHSDIGCRCCQDTLQRGHRAG